ncbi:MULTISPECIES: cytochrome c biogenesis CcdA family protein [Geobacter]|uniref:cytochrome c biogenesis CcdA family protein n=1 Tax=Geobacter TaxID=28231 RepID=UPI002572C56E|nr:cytochrome c biogenesis protein CcdA [Geobacter sulfurreducens]BEH10693.1 cytochrome c biogenesis protein CcdA [Geobacter sulfurreducens subsp. ethanolicus]BET58538.1 cytochrome c biogenesis protein CcdA [Geobacter sp. 60473]HML79552.1 cytochrome c biogenesis protein CcdA [Geobacter sulfurreducens]
MESTNITFVGAFVAGLLSFLSPCVLPLIPSFITYITGLSFADIQSEHPTHKVRQQTIVHSLLFIAGFTFVFVLLGASATFIGGFLHEHMNVIRKVGGVLIVIFGIHVSGLVPIHLLLGEKRLQVHRKPAGYLGSFLVGLAFAAGWTPCIGPILASILMVAATEETVSKGILLLFTYSMGLAIPFFLSSLAMHQFLTFFNRFKKHIRILEIVTGLFLVVVGVMIFTNYLSVLSRYTMKWFGGM